MQAVRHLLCPVDLSEPSAHALRYAAAFRVLRKLSCFVLTVKPDGFASQVRVETA